MTDRDPLRSLHRRQHRDIRDLYVTLADAVENAVARQVTREDTPRPITESDRVAIMREVDKGLDVLWGRQRGYEAAAVLQVVIRDTKAARLHPLDRAVKAWRSAMPRSLWERVKREAGGE